MPEQIQHSHKVSRAFIKVGERRRKIIPEVHVQQLADSIKRVGLINPIIIQRDGTLWAGECRLRAFDLLKRTEIPIAFTDETDEAQLRLLELEENIRRFDMHWTEEATAVLELHNLRVEAEGKIRKGQGAKFGGWSQADTGAMLGLKKTQISDILGLASALQAYPEIRKIPTKSAAIRRLRQMKSLKIRQELVRRLKKKTPGNQVSLLGTAEVFTGDALNILAKTEDNTFDLFILDPPWGVDTDKSDDDVLYDDSEQASTVFLMNIIPHLARTLQDNRHTYIMVGYSRLGEVVDIVSSFLSVDPIPIVWVKPNPARVPSGLRWPPCYVPILHCWKGSRELDMTSIKTNVISDIKPVPGVRRIHPHQKPIALYQRLIEVSTIEGELVCDPCCGSGACGVAAIRSNRVAVCIEKSAEAALSAEAFITANMAIKGDQK